MLFSTTKSMKIGCMANRLILDNTIKQKKSLAFGGIDPGELGKDHPSQKIVRTSYLVIRTYSWKTEQK